MFPGVSLPWAPVLGGQLCRPRSLLPLLPSQSVLLDADPGKNVHQKHLQHVENPLLHFCSPKCSTVISFFSFNGCRCYADRSVLLKRVLTSDRFVIIDPICTITIMYVCVSPAGDIFPLVLCVWESAHEIPSFPVLREDSVFLRNCSNRHHMSSDQF